MEYTLGEESEAPSQRLFSSEELSRQLEKLLKEGSSNQRVFDWIEVCSSWMLGKRDKGEVVLGLGVGAARMETSGHNSELRSIFFSFLLHRPT